MFAMKKKKKKNLGIVISVLHLDYPAFTAVLIALTSQANTEEPQVFCGDVGITGAELIYSCETQGKSILRK